MTDSEWLDDVIQLHQNEVQAQRAHNSTLSQRAVLLVEVWTGSISPLVNEMNRKLEKHHLQFEFSGGNFGEQRGAGSVSTIYARSGSLTSRRKPLPPLVMELTNRGTIVAKVLGQVDDTAFQSRTLDVGDGFPEKQIRQILAEYVGYCLRLTSRSQSSQPIE